MGKDVFGKITRLLKEKKIDFKAWEHTPVFTSEEAAKVRGSSLKCGAKALIFYADGAPVMLVISGDKRVDVKKFKTKFNIRDLRFAKPEEVEEVMDGVKVGAVHPIGTLHHLPVYLDEGLGKCRQINFNAGLHEKSIKMYYKDYIKLVKPIMGDFGI